MLGEISVSIIANLQIVTAQPGHILYNYGGHITGLYILQHLLKAGTVKIRPGITVINIEPCVGKVMLFRVLGEQFFLERDLSRKTLSPIQKMCKGIINQQYLRKGNYNLGAANQISMMYHIN